ASASRPCRHEPAVPVTETAARLLAAYRATRYDVRLPGGRRCTIRIGRACPARLAAPLAAAGFLAIVSACNPRSRPLAAHRNRRRMRALAARLLAQGARCLPAAGVLGDWREFSLCVSGIALDRLDA